MVCSFSLSDQLRKVFNIAVVSEEGQKHFNIVPRNQVIQFEPDDGRTFHVKITMDGQWEVGEGAVPFQRYYVSRIKGSCEIFKKLLTGEKSFTDVYMDDEIEVYGEWDIRNWFATLVRIAREIGGRI